VYPRRDSGGPVQQSLLYATFQKKEAKSLVSCFLFLVSCAVAVLLLLLLLLLLLIAVFCCWLLLL
jgi:hypothetical protein